MGPVRHAELQDSLERLAATIAADQGVELVELSLRGPGGRRLLRVDIDRVGPRGVTIDDCQRVSRALEAALDEAGLLDAHYVLEVSSPGADRPIVTADDYRRNVGRRLLVVVAQSNGERRRLRGELVGLKDGLIRLRSDSDSEVQVPLEGVVEARQDVTF